MPYRKWAVAIATGLALPLVTETLNHTPEARACGGFFRPASDERKPSLSYEQALILYDPAHQKEHFIREVTFRGGAQTFGFVVPTPGRPEVAKVGTSPFGRLRMAFPFTPPDPLSLLGIGAAGRGGGSGFGAGAVRVLEVSKVGSFTAFVLAATDARALANWLAKNHLVSTPEADAWLAHYVRMGFYYVAMRYDAPKPAAGDTSALGDSPLESETIRISFSTPAPYYPYFEPRRSAEEEPTQRLLELWLVTPQPMTPVSLATRDGHTSWVRPLREGGAYTAARPALESAFDDALELLLPSSPLGVQTFQDQKFSRDGYGDILFVPQAGARLTEADQQLLEPLLGVLDPSLIGIGAKK